MKTYRAFAELDRFTDEQAAHLLDRATARSGGVAMAATAWRSLPWLVVMGVVCQAVLFVLLPTDRVPRALASVHAGVRSWGGNVQVVAPIVAISVCMICLLGIRNVEARVGVRRHLKRTACRECGASMLGAERTLQGVTCGACGAVFTFSELKLDSEDFGPPLLVPLGGGKCPACSYELRGLPIRRGVVTCPECGGQAAVG